MASYMVGRANAPLCLFPNGDIGGMDVDPQAWGNVAYLKDIPRTSYSCWYCAEDNLVHYFNGSAVESISQREFVGSFNVDSNNKITSFTPKTVFHAVDYSDFADEVVRTSDNQTIGGTKTFSAAAYGIASDAINSILTTTGINKAQSGYVKLGNGLIIQWLHYQTITQNTAITLPTAFTSAASYSAIAVRFGTDETMYPLTTRAQTSTTVAFNRYTGTGNNYKANIIAIGY